MSFLEETILAPHRGGVELRVGSGHRILPEAASLTGTSTFRALFLAAIVIVGLWSSNCMPVDQCGWSAPNAAAPRPASVSKLFSPAP